MNIFEKYEYYLQDEDKIVNSIKLNVTTILSQIQKW